jgi:hypothetical protein
LFPKLILRIIKGERKLISSPRDKGKIFMKAQTDYNSQLQGLKELELTTSIFAPTLYLEKVPGPALFAAAAEGTSWSVQEAKGRIQGVGVRVSGLGAYARASGTMNFSTRTLETSRTYQEMKRSYGFSGGIRGFWSWIGFGANASSHKEELTRLFNELSQEQKTNGKINIDLYVTGLYLTFQYMLRHTS